MSHVLELPSKSSVATFAKLSGTLAEIRAQRLEWEHDADRLLDAFDDLAVRAAVASAAADQRVLTEVAAAQAKGHAAEASEVASDREQWAELRREQQQSEARHQTSAQELAAMRHLLEQQTELLTAFVGAATQWSQPAPAPPTSPAVRQRPGIPADPVVRSVQAQFAQLKQPAGVGPAARSITPPKSAAG